MQDRHGLIELGQLRSKMMLVDFGKKPNSFLDAQPQLAIKEWILTSSFPNTGRKSSLTGNFSWEGSYSPYFPTSNDNSRVRQVSRMSFILFEAIVSLHPSPAKPTFAVVWSPRICWEKIRQWVCVGFVRPGRAQNLACVRSRLWRIAGWMEALSHSPPSPTSTPPAQIPPAPLIWIKLFQFIRFPCSHPVSKKPLLKCQVWI